MLDDFGNELESTESKIDSTMKKVAKVLHMNNGELLVDLYYCGWPVAGKPIDDLLLLGGWRWWRFLAMVFLNLFM